MDRVAGSITIKRAIPEDDILQPITMVIRVNRKLNEIFLIMFINNA